MTKTDSLICSLCQRVTPEAYYEKHHLTPHCKKGSNYIWMCQDCADQVHELFTNNELRDIYNTLESLLSNEKIQKWIQWIRKKPNEFGVCMKKLKRKR
jgi:ribosomal silencing factor RsfS